MITENKEKKILALYDEKKCSITEIMKMTDVGSSQTIYKILAKYGFNRQRQEKQARRIHVCLDDQADRILKKLAPANVSKLICMLIKKSYPELG